VNGKKANVTFFFRAKAAPSATKFPEQEIASKITLCRAISSFLSGHVALQTAVSGRHADTDGLEQCVLSFSFRTLSPSIVFE
jgi:hypothetical protein